MVGDFKGMALGSIKDNGWFWIGAGWGEVQRAVVTESAFAKRLRRRIDAISLAVLEKGQHQGRSIYLSTDGKGALPVAALQSVRDRDGSITAAFDADSNGRRLTEKLTAIVSNADSLIPQQGKDWNEQLLSVRQELRNCYRQARDIGRSDNHLQRIAQVGKAFTQDGTPLTQPDRQAMAKDQETWQQQVQTVANCAQVILDKAGEAQAGGTLFAGKKYVLFCRDDCLYSLAEQRGTPLTEEDQKILPDSLLKPNQGIILKVNQGEISTTATRAAIADMQRFQRFAELVSTNLQEHQPER